MTDAPKAPRYALTQEYIRATFSYEPATELVRWRVKSSRSIIIGQVAGTKTKNCKIQIRLDGHFYLAHHLVWLYVYGEQPKRLDHRDRNPSNNRLSNLRVSTHMENQRNRGRQANNVSGYKGVIWHSGKWLAKICADGRHYNLGRFTFIEDAARAYDEAAYQHHGEFACVNFPRKGERDART